VHGISFTANLATPRTYRPHDVKPKLYCFDLLWIRRTTSCETSCATSWKLYNKSTTYRSNGVWAWVHKCHIKSIFATDQIQLQAHASGHPKCRLYWRLASFR